MNPNKTTMILMLLLMAAQGSSLGAQEKPAKEQPGPLLERTGPTIVFLGDSITAGGHYINMFETWTLLNRPAAWPKVIGLGLSSETVSGLSEPDHPFPRPFVHDRLTRVLDETNPDIVVACYGINCGIYHPFSEERFQAYQDGIRKLIRLVRERNAEVILMTPPPYANAVVKRTQPKAAGRPSYKQPYQDYDQVMAKYAAWILTLDGEPDVSAIDLRSPMIKHMQTSYSRDPIHPNRSGHEVMAKTFLRYWATRKASGDRVKELDLKTGGAHWQTIYELVQQRRQTYDKTLLAKIGHRRPGAKPKTTYAEAQQVALRIDQQLASLLSGR